jgi:hypothetical protein
MAGENGLFNRPRLGRITYPMGVEAQDAARQNPCLGGTISKGEKELLEALRILDKDCNQRIREYPEGDLKFLQENHWDLQMWMSLFFQGDPWKPKGVSISAW